jgi:hypothetical protein
VNSTDRVRYKTFEGVLIPVRWVSGGEVHQLSLMTFDEDEYWIDPAVAEAHDLGELLRRHIRIVGRARGRRLVEVASVELLGAPGEPAIRREEA